MRGGVAVAELREALQGARASLVAAGAREAALRTEAARLAALTEQHALAEAAAAAAAAAAEAAAGVRHAKIGYPSQHRPHGPAPVPASHSASAPTVGRVLSTAGGVRCHGIEDERQAMVDDDDDDDDDDTDDDDDDDAWY
eukprot:COSAG01_NODE_1029_length_12019_cov_560.144631_6_plen_140_part_00